MMISGSAVFQTFKPMVERHPQGRSAGAASGDPSGPPAHSARPSRSRVGPVSARMLEPGFVGDGCYSGCLRLCKGSLPNNNYV